jgi:hypothetical protein
MFILGLVLAVYGFGSLVAKQFFDRDFGLLNRWFEGGALTTASVVAGLLGVLLMVVSARRALNKKKN